MQLYFAYGSNLSTSQMKERCCRPKPLEVGCLKRYRLDFTHYSHTWKGGVADVVEDPDYEVWGLVYELSMKDLHRLDDYEGYPDIYTRFQTSIKAQLGSISNVWVYTVVKKKNFIPPTKAYIELIKSSAVKLVFPDTYCSYLDMIETR